MPTPRATAREISEASQAFIRTTPSRTNRVSSGSAAKIELRNSEPPTGSST